MDSRRGKIKSLKIVRTPYIQLLKQDLPHRNYFDSFACSQTPEICEDGPTRDNIKVSKSSLKFNLPYPISRPEAKAVKQDPCFELVNKKQAFLSKIESAKKKYQHDKHWLTDSKVMNNKVEFIPEYVYELTNGKSADVDPYFNSCYDFYYAGGNLCRIGDGDQTAVIYPDEGGHIYCTNIKTTQTTPLMNLGGGTIYNIKSFQNNNYLTIRQKHEISLARVKFKRDKYKAKHLWNINSTAVPLNDCDLISDNEMCYTDMEQNLRILDMNKEACKYEHKFMERESRLDDDGLLQVKYLDANNLSVMGRDYLSIFDQRSATCSIYQSEETFFTCNQYCVFCRSNCSDNYLYVGTKHNVLKFDLRKTGVVKKWTHFMSLDPNVIKMGRCGGQEVVCVSGFVDTVCFSTGDANYTPVQLMKASAAFDECRLRKKFVLREGLEERFGTGTVGVEFLERNSKSSDFAVFTCNSVGDVFRHDLKNELKMEEGNVDEYTAWMFSYAEIDQTESTLYPAPSGISDMNMDKFISWVDSVPELACPLSVTSRKNARCVKKFLLKNQAVDSKEDEQDEEEPDLEPLWEVLDQYMDHNFSSIWSSGTPLDIDGALTSVTPQSKVSEWLESTLHSEEIIKDEF